MLIADIYKNTPYFVKEDATVRDALCELLNQEFNGVLVEDNNKHVVGVLSIQDIASATVPREYKKNVSLASATYKEGFFEEIAKEVGNKKVKDVMRTEFMKVTPESHIMEVAADFMHEDLYVVPVIDGTKVVGIITRSEIKKALAKSMGCPTK